MIPKVKRLKKMKSIKVNKGNKVVEATPFKKNKEGILKKIGKSPEVKSKIHSLASRMFKS